jgi:hypothetical protein
LEIVQGLWIGPRLSTIERLSIRSFLANGHPYHLYVYDEVANVPEGAVVRNAGEILPRERIFRSPPGTGSYAAFADFFRYRLLLERGGWWCDLDTVCLRPLRFGSPCVMSSERVEGYVHPNSGVLRFPRGHVAMEWACRVCEGADPGALAPCEAGPVLIDWLVRKLRLEEFVQEPEVFCPVPCGQMEQIVTRAVPIPDTAYAVHLWNENWTRCGLDKDGEYPADCLFERLKRQWLV